MNWASQVRPWLFSVARRPLGSSRALRFRYLTFHFFVSHYNHHRCFVRSFTPIPADDLSIMSSSKAVNVMMARQPSLTHPVSAESLCRIWHPDRLTSPRICCRRTRSWRSRCDPSSQLLGVRHHLSRGHTCRGHSYAPQPLLPRARDPLPTRKLRVLSSHLDCASDRDVNLWGLPHSSRLLRAPGTPAGCETFTSLLRPRLHAA